MKKETAGPVTQTAEKHPGRMKRSRLWQGLVILVLVLVIAASGLWVKNMSGSQLAHYVNLPTATWLVRHHGSSVETFVTLSGNRAVDKFVAEIQDARIPTKDGRVIVVNFAENKGRQYGLFIRYSVMYDYELM